MTSLSLAADRATGIFTSFAKNAGRQKARRRIGSVCAYTAMPPTARFTMAFAILRKTSMRFLAAINFIWFFPGCVGTPAACASEHIAVGMNSFALAARYGKPSNYQHQGDHLQLNYGGESAGCRIILLIDEHQRVTGWVPTGAKCGAQPDRAGAP